MPDSSRTPDAPRGPVPDRLIDCPTAGVCPPCSEGWGHWSAEREAYFPTKHSTGWHRECGCSPLVHPFDTECPRPAFRALMDDLTSTDNDRDLLAITRRERDYWESEARSWRAKATQPRAQGALRNPLRNLWQKRPTSSGRFEQIKRSGDVFKGVRREN